MVATVILGMLCVHLLCFCVMFYLISTRLHGKKMGMDIFALGNLMLGCAYLLQLTGDASDAESLAMNVTNHTLTLCAPVVYLLAALRFFERPTRVAKPLVAFAITYAAAQLLIEWTLGTAARHALLALSCAVLFFGMASTALYGVRSFAKDLRVEMVMFALLIGGICVLNAAKFTMILLGGMEALQMGTRFQTVFYIYMSFLGTVLPPCIVWLVLRRLTEDLRAMAARDPLTKLLNRRGLTEALTIHFGSRNAGPAHVLLLDIDHFKKINDTYGHKVGDLVLCHVAQVLQKTARHGDLTCRLGGEEFVAICLDTGNSSAMQVAERIRTAIEKSPVKINDQGHTISCTVTIGVSYSFTSMQELDISMQQADAGLYQGKDAGRNRVERINASRARTTPSPSAPEPCFE